MSRSKYREIEATRYINSGPEPVPPYLVLAQRHFEKSPPPVVDDTVTLTVPLDLLRLTGVPPWLLADIEEITVTYKRRR